MSQPGDWAETSKSCPVCDTGRMWCYTPDGAICCDTCPTIHERCKDDKVVRQLMQREWRD